MLKKANTLVKASRESRFSVDGHRSDTKATGTTLAIFQHRHCGGWSVLDINKAGEYCDYNRLCWVTC
jgi:hypothetical protein